MSVIAFGLYTSPWSYTLVLLLLYFTYLALKSMGILDS